MGVSFASRLVPLGSLNEVSGRSRRQSGASYCQSRMDTSYRETTLS